jgi:hypothetical protein
MSDINCTHKKGGDTINGSWVCSQCFQKLPDRPSVLSQEKIRFRLDGDGDGMPHGARRPMFRQKVNYTPIAICEGVTLYQFIQSLASRFVARTKGAMNMYDATDYALSLMQDFDEEFGAIDFAWDAGGAFEIADEDMQHWDHDDGGANS